MFDLDGDATARLFYLAGLLLLVSSGFFAAYRNRLGQGLQHAAIWGLIFFGVVVAYGLRDQFSAALRDDAAIVLEDGRAALRRGGDGHFHARAEVNGVSIPFLIDTGATALVLTQQDAERVGVDPDTLVYASPARTANGVVMSARTTLGSLRLGPFEDRDVPAMVNGGALGVSLMGMGYLNRFGRVSIQGDRMVLER